MVGSGHVIGRQVLRSGTAIGALVREAEQGESRRDFVHKLAIALKEAHETDYWLELLDRSGSLPPKASASLRSDLNELVALLTSIIKRVKRVEN
jgi:four helix bundle protein